MRRVASALVLAAVCVVAAAAVVDAVTRSGENAEPADAAAARRPDAATSFGGTLALVDDRCRLTRIDLSSLTRVGRTRRVGCSLELDARGRLAPAGVIRRPGSLDVEARCTGGRITVSTRASYALLHTSGCAPAWQPDGTLTYVYEGEVRWSGRLWDRRVLIGRDELRGGRAIRVAWLDDRRAAVIVGRAGRRVLELHEGGRRIGRPVPLRGRIAGLAASPSGGYAAATTSHGVAVVARDGEPAALPLVAVRAITWSPDERWALAAGPRSTFLFRPGATEMRLRRVPVRATQLAWLP